MERALARRHGTGTAGHRATVRRRPAGPFGEALQLFAAAAHHDRLTREAERAMTVTVDAVERNWARPDAGLWELEDRWWTQSRLSVVADLRRAAQVLPARSALAEYVPGTALRVDCAPSAPGVSFSSPGADEKPASTDRYQDQAQPAGCRAHRRLPYRRRPARGCGRRGYPGPLRQQ